MQSSSMTVNGTITSAVEVSSAITTTEGFSRVITSMVLPPLPPSTITVGSLKGTSIGVQASSTTSIPGLSGAASFTSTALPTAQLSELSVKSITAATVKPTTTSSVNGKY